MGKLAQLRASLKDKRRRADELLAAASGEDVTQEQLDAITALNTECEAIEEEIASEQAKLETLASLRSAHTAQGERLGQPEPLRSQPNSEPRITNLRDRETDSDTCGYRNMGEFARDVKEAFRPGMTMPEMQATTPRLVKMMKAGFASGDILNAPSNYHNENTGSEGGFMTPPQFRDQIFDLTWNQPGNDLLSLFDFQPTESNSVLMVRDQTTPWGTSGVYAAWRNEGGQMSATKVADNLDQIRLNSCYVFCLATDEMLQDTTGMSDRLTRKASEAIRYKVSQAIINGDGVAKPKGFFQEGSGVSLVQQAKDGSQTADTITIGNVANMLGRLLKTGTGRGFWLIGPDSINQLIKLTIGDQPVWTNPMEGVKGSPAGTLLGMPVYECHHCEVLGDEGDILLVNPDGYFGARKTGGPTADTSMHLYFDYGVEAFRWTFRVAGQPVLSSAITLENGTTTQSHFVSVAARA